MLVQGLLDLSIEVGEVKGILIGFFPGSRRFYLDVAFGIGTGRLFFNVV